MLRDIRVNDDLHWFQERCYLSDISSREIEWQYSIKRDKNIIFI